ncbi:DnaB-like helicase C-terminal domain-containing protein [Rhodococcus erythropolis]
MVVGRVIAYQRIIDAFRNEGLNVKEVSTGKAQAQAPGHSQADYSVSITDIGEQALVYCHGNDDTETVLQAVGLKLADLFDSPSGVAYEYPDGRKVHRSTDKQFRQSGNTTGNQLLDVEQLTDASTVYVVEGEKDVRAIQSQGGTATCTAMGAGKAHKFDLSPLHGKQVIIVRDMDAPGAEHAKQLVELLVGHADVSIVKPKEGKDAADHIGYGHSLNDFQPDDSARQITMIAKMKLALEQASSMPADDALSVLYRALDSQATQESLQGLTAWDDLVGEWSEWVTKPATQAEIVPTPWKDLNDKLAGGLHSGRSYLIAGRPGGGKSLGITNFASYAAQKGARGLIYTVEMGRVEIASRIIAAGAEVEYGSITKRSIPESADPRIQQWINKAGCMPLMVNDNPNMTIQKIRQQARMVKAKHGLDFVAIDYLQILKPVDSKVSRQEQISQISQAVKLMSRELDIAVLTAAQVNRGNAKDQRPPTIADLRESGSLEQDADVVMLLHHEEIEGMATGEVQVILGKNRTGPLTTVVLPWRPHFARIG